MMNDHKNEIGLNLFNLLVQVLLYSGANGATTGANTTSPTGTTAATAAVGAGNNNLAAAATLAAAAAAASASGIAGGNETSMGGDVSHMRPGVGMEIGHVS